MKKILPFLQKEIVLWISGLLAAVSLFLVPPDEAYAGYIHWQTLAVLFCLMAVTSGLRRAGVFDRLARALTAGGRSGRQIGLALTGACFFLSALITNDVTLLTFVPFTISLYGRDRRLIPLLVLETVAANLGSLMTPVGNPQNLFLYSYYGLGAGAFFRLMLPLGALCLGLTALCALILLRDGPLPRAAAGQSGPLPRFALCRYALLFALCLLTVLRALDWRICLGVTALCLLVFDRPLFRRIDYSLLLSFVFFFVLVGNLARLAPVEAFLRETLRGRELLVSALASQLISNVPAAAMLAPFTDAWRGLLLGVNIGGLGTLIASMASLITYRFYAVSQGARRGRYFALFSAVNFALLGLLLPAAAILF